MGFFWYAGYEFQKVGGKSGKVTPKITYILKFKKQSLQTFIPNLESVLALKMV